MPANLGLPLLSNPIPTLRRWASELRNKAFVVEDDFTWKSWEPTITPDGAMTITGLIINVAEYIVINKICFFTINFQGTLASFATDNIDFSLPLPVSSSWPSLYTPVAGVVVDNGTLISAAAWVYRDLQRGSVYRYDEANFTLAAVVVGVSGHYRVA